MAGFLYLVAGRSRVKQDDLASIGIDYAFDGAIATRETNSDTAARAPGVVVANPRQHDAIGYHAERQTWRKMHRDDDGPEVWLGFWNDDPPQPIDLRRETPLRTVSVRLDDDREWDVPIIGHPENGRLEADLPAWMDMDEQGRRIRGELLAEYRDIWEVTSSIADRMLAVDVGDKEAQAPSDDEMWEATVNLLQSVYRVGVYELVAMKCFLEDSPSLPIVWQVATNYKWLVQQLEATAKKNKPAMPAGRNTSVGAPA